MKVVIIKYNAGNVFSVDIALQRLGVTPIISENPEEITAADKVIFPGVGAAGTAMQFLKERKLDVAIKALNQPILGICLGMQLLCSHSEEDDTDCLGIFPQSVKRFTRTVKTPQVGWNSIYNLKSALVKKIRECDCMYFVHSYYIEPNEYTIAETSCQHSYSAAIKKNNFYAVQFHPEKSGEAGQHILKNFLDL